ncbi:uncharacterized protein PGTG_00788 [Puccinia graminis f. sp. tritici CRL 75-36-700-3]|uniref:CCHC-type domain-containing protein n=1 Tax=Puccinia graminis f. sp. tritici (strain CRL 75-36-700-3 / race SCCL) TaxID=418459 RepID=E3JTQ6_PUCGT|nr:uncharacterized protein PGTG_00788 [Puccinia graminis f. sp. tritici CRL 75-36-700-3]EFP75457.2 hypothetical protein PGTG_00788 [Puccinia graminis f. sp. tritici CRL 75-36-700-3]
MSTPSDKTSKPSSKSHDPPPHLSPAMSTDLTGHPTLKITSIEKLKPPGPDSNYLDWSWVLDIHFDSTGVSYILDPKEANPEAKPTFARDNKAICSVISQTINSANIRVVRQFNKDTRKMWNGLRAAHQDSSSGGVMYWLRKLTMFRMENDDIETHLEEMAKVFERLEALADPARPLTVDDFYSSSIITSLSAEWMPCVSSLLNEPHVPSHKVVAALKQEGLRRKARIEDLQAPESVSKTTTSLSNRQRRTARHCTYCGNDGHDLNYCHKLARFIEDRNSTGKERVPAPSGSLIANPPSSRGRYNKTHQA